MDQKTKQYLQTAAVRSEELGPYYAIGTVQGICENTELPAREKIEHIRYLMGLLVSEREEGMA